MMSSAGEFDLRAGWVALLAVVLLVASAPARAQQANLWSHELPADKPVLIDSIGSLETTVLVQVRQGRPLKWTPEPRLLIHFAG